MAQANNKIIFGLQPSREQAIDLEYPLPEVIQNLQAVQKQTGALKIIQEDRFYAETCPTGTHHVNSHENYQVGELRPKHTDHHADIKPDGKSKKTHTDCHFNYETNRHGGTHTDNHTNTCSGKETKNEPKFGNKLLLTKSE